eukprot:jgi/Mesvir1/27379/Mv07185-RA.1
MAGGPPWGGMLTGLRNALVRAVCFVATHFGAALLSGFVSDAIVKLRPSLNDGQKSLLNQHVQAALSAFFEGRADITQSLRGLLAIIFYDMSPEDQVLLLDQIVSLLQSFYVNADSSAANSSTRATTPGLSLPGQQRPPPQQQQQQRQQQQQQQQQPRPGGPPPSGPSSWPFAGPSRPTQPPLQARPAPDYTPSAPGAFDAELVQVRGVARDTLARLPLAAREALANELSRDPPPTCSITMDDVLDGRGRVRPGVVALVQFSQPAASSSSSRPSSSALFPSSSFPSSANASSSSSASAAGGATTRAHVFVYNKRALDEWFAVGGTVNPMTRERVDVRSQLFAIS